MSPTPATRIACLGDVELSAFAEGRLAEAESVAVADHLATCQSCERTYRLVASASPLLQMLRQPCELSVGLEPECQQMQSAARELARRASHAPDEASQESTDSTRLSTDWPQAKSRPGNDLTTVSRDATPEKIGRYRIQSILGEGAYGLVYLALDPDLDRQVALKVPKFTSQIGGKAGGPLVDALLREARTAAKLKHHPNIVTIYDVGPDDQVGCYVAMEYVEGKSLKVMTGDKVPHEQAAKYVAQAAEAVHFAHKHGLVHRDLKPSNLLIDADDNVKVADFGLALFEEEQRKRAGEFAGTLAYCSPEQVRGEVHHLDGRTDIWSLGIVLYELLTGRRPFGGENIVDEILHRPPKPLRQTDDTIPLELERICVQCLAKESSGRCPTAKDLAHQLRAVGRVEPRVQVQFSMWSVTIAIVVSAMLLVAVLAPVIYWSLTGNSADSAQPAIATNTLSKTYHVDAVAKPFVPLHLLSRPPRELFPTSDPTEQWLYRAEREEVWLDTPSSFLIGLGETGLDSYRLQVEISRNEPHGEAGLFLGYRPVRGKGGAERWTMEMVCIRGSASGELVVNRTSGEVTKSGRTFGLSKHTHAFNRVTPSALRRSELRVTVQANQITEVRWMGAPLPDLVKLQPEAAVGTFRGQFGVIGFNGASWFHNARFEALEQPGDP
jgi:serine/threonine protein kinase